MADGWEATRRDSTTGYYAGKEDSTTQCTVVIWQGKTSE